MHLFAMQGSQDTLYAIAWRKFIVYCIIYSRLSGHNGSRATCPGATVAASLAIILLQNITFPSHLDMSSPLLSKLQPEHSSMCSCVSWPPSLQYLHSRLVNDLLLFTLTPFMDLALSLNHILLFGRDMQVSQLLASGSSVQLSPTFTLALISSVISCFLKVAIACLISPSMSKAPVRWVSLAIVTL